MLSFEALSWVGYLLLGFHLFGRFGGLSKSKVIFSQKRIGPMLFLESTLRLRRERLLLEADILGPGLSKNAGLLP